LFGEIDNSRAQPAVRYGLMHQQTVAQACFADAIWRRVSSNQDRRNVIVELGPQALDGSDAVLVVSQPIV